MSSQEVSMRTALALVLMALPLVVAAQEAPQKEDPSKSRVEVTGCVKGSTLTETNLRISDGGAAEGPARRWRLRGPKALMNRLKQHGDREVEIAGTMKSPDTMGSGRRIGRTNIFIGGDPARTARDPLPDLPTIDVESFEVTGEQCR
jgi:hypothetical protein